MNYTILKFFTLLIYDKLRYKVDEFVKGYLSYQHVYLSNFRFLIINGFDRLINKNIGPSVKFEFEIKSFY